MFNKLANDVYQTHELNKPLMTYITNFDKNIFN